MKKRIVFFAMICNLFLLSACTETKVQTETSSPTDGGQEAKKAEKVKKSFKNLEDVSIDMWKDFSDTQKDDFIKQYLAEQKVTSFKATSPFRQHLNKIASKSNNETNMFELLRETDSDASTALEEAQSYLDEIAVALKEKDEEKLTSHYRGQDFGDLARNNGIEEFFSISNMDFNFTILDLLIIGDKGKRQEFGFLIEVDYSVEFDENEHKLNKDKFGYDYSNWVFSSSEGDISNKKELSAATFMKYYSKGSDKDKDIINFLGYAHTDEERRQQLSDYWDKVAK